MTMPTFHSGPPPIECGWMLTRTIYRYNSKDCWRWWNGRRWSAVAYSPAHTASSAAHKATLPPFFTNDEIKWSLFYPPNARVPESEARVFN